MQLIIVLERTSFDPPTISYVLRATVPAAQCGTGGSHGYYV
jgi:hypothetical protein